MSEKPSPEDRKWLDKHESELTPELELNDLYAVEQYGLTDGQKTEWAMPDVAGVARDVEESGSGGYDDWEPPEDQREIEAEARREEIKGLEHTLKRLGNKVTREKRETWERRLELLRDFQEMTPPKKRTKKEEAELDAYWKEQNALWQEFYDEKWRVMKLAPTERRLCELMTKHSEWKQTKLALKLGITQSQVSRVLKKIKLKQQLANREVGGGHTSPDFQFRHWLKNRNNK